MFSTAVEVATDGAAAAATGTAAALVNVAQQSGVALGTALLSGIAHAASPSGSDAYAGAHAAFTAGAGIFAVGALLTAVLLHRSSVEDRRHADRDPRMQVAT